MVPEHLAAVAARAQYSSHEKQLEDMKARLGGMTTQLAVDHGKQNEYFSMKGKTYSVSQGQYVVYLDMVV